MTPLMVAGQVRALESLAMSRGETAGKLMERAGRGVVEAMVDWRPGLDEGEHRAAVLCGPGNNGGDGFVIARLLKEGGWEVDLFLAGDERKLPEDASVNARKWRWMRADVIPLSAERFQPEFYDVVVDAMFGAGLSRPLEGAAAEAAALLDRPRRKFAVVAVDAPSGLCMDSGKVLGARAVRADLTVTFQVARPGLYLDRGPEHCGDVAVADIGLPLAAYARQREQDEGAEPSLELVDRIEPALLAKRGDGHKYAYGHAFIVAGPSGAGGAARLAARAALRVGAGLVTLGCNKNAVAENAARLDAVMIGKLPDAKALAAFLEDERINAWCIGPGHGVGKPTRDDVLQIAAAGRALVLDADALTSFEGMADDLFAAIGPQTVLTPHLGEFRRIFPDLAEGLEAPAESGPAYSRVDAVREAAARAGAVVLLKGAATVIASPDGSAAIHAASYGRSAPWLATAGAGDVLAGTITGLMARGLGPEAAACTAAWLHVEAARKAGPGLIAEDLPDALPAVFRDMGL